MRLFVALEAPEAWRLAAAAQQQALLDALPAETQRTLRMVAPVLMHLTLRFLGEQDEGAVDPLQAALDAIAPVAVALTLERAGSFGPAARTSAIWLGVGGDTEALHALAARVEQAVRLAGLPPEERPLAAHLTLARVGRQAPAEPRRAIAAAVRALAPPPPSPYVVSALALVQSHLDGPAPRYDVLSRHP